MSAYTNSEEQQHVTPNLLKNYNKEEVLSIVPRNKSLEKN